MNDLAGYEIEVKINPAFVRSNEIKTLTGSTQKLKEIIGDFTIPAFKSTLMDMYNS